MTKRKKTFLIVLSVLLAITIGALFTINGIVAGIISKKADAYLATHPVKNYNVSYGRIGFNLLNRSAKIIDITLTPKTAYLDSLSRSGLSYLIPEITSGKIVVAGIDYKNIFSGNNLNISKIRIHKLHVILRKISGRKKENTTTKTKKSKIPESFKVKGLNSLRINSFLLDKSKFELIDQKTGNIIAASQNIELEVKNFVLLPLENKPSFFKPDYDDVILVIKDTRYFTPDKLYEIMLGNIAAGLKTKKFVATKVEYRPLYSKSEFTKHLKYQQERYDVKIGSIEFYIPDPVSLINDNTLLIHNVTINKANINIFRDKQIPFPHFKRPLLPHQALKHMKLMLNVDTLILKNSKFAYEELTGRNKQPLFVNFKKLSAEITNISNIPRRKYSQSKMRAALHGRLMGKAPFNLNLVFPMMARNDTMTFQGEILGKVPFKIFNKASFPAAGINFRGGTLNKLTFTGGANPRYSKGTLTMLYNNVKLDFVKKGKQKADKFLSWGATTVIRKDNPPAGKPPKKAVMTYTRDMEKGFGNFLWKTVFSGMKGTFIGGKKSFVQPDKKQKKNRKSRKKTGR